MSSHQPLVALTGATGYIGGRLLRALEGEGARVRCLARRPEFLRPRAAPATEVVRADCLEPASLTAGLAGVEFAYYLVHSMGSSHDYSRADVNAARNFGAAARAAGVRRIIYLGGLGDDRTALSTHLQSRHDTGDALRASGVPVIELRASIVIGSGSLSFELIRALVERLPVMICPRWVFTPAQPIAIDDVLAYLLAARHPTHHADAIFEIGGTDQVSYAEIMREYARQRGLRRILIVVPVLTPRLSSLWLGLTTPLYARVGRQLAEGLRHPTVVQNDAARRAFPIAPMGLRDAIARALRNEEEEFIVTRWSDAVSSAAVPRRYGGIRFGTRLVDARRVEVAVSAADAFEPIRRIGGAAGWYHAEAGMPGQELLDLRPTVPRAPLRHDAHAAGKAGGPGGGLASPMRPRWIMMRRMTCGSSIVASTRIRPPSFGGGRSPTNVRGLWLAPDGAGA